MHCTSTICNYTASRCEWVKARGEKNCPGHCLYKWSTITLRLSYLSVFCLLTIVLGCLISQSISRQTHLHLHGATQLTKLSLWQVGVADKGACKDYYHQSGSIERVLLG